MEEEAMTGDPIVELDAGFSAEDGRATPWATALELLEEGRGVRAFNRRPDVRVRGA